MGEPANDVLAAMEVLGAERQAMVTLSFNPLDGDRGWIASVSHSRAIGIGASPREALADLQAKCLQREPGMGALAS